MHYLAGVGLLAILAMTIVDIIGRSAFKTPLPGTVEVTSMLLVFVVFLAVAHSEDMGDHITIDLIYERVGKGAKRFLDVFSDLLTIAVMSLMAFQLYHFGFRNLDSGAETPVLDWPVWPFVFVASFGAGLYALSTVLRLILRLRGEPVNVVEEGADDATGGVEV
jgi:TRAP-type C4-dicarboxylate transport system permease small subunit